MRAEINGCVLFLLIILSCCGTKQQEIPARLGETPVGGESKISGIVLINAGERNRCELGELIQRISKCNPKVVGINFLFIGNKDVYCDSTLRTSMIDSDKVVLIE